MTNLRKAAEMACDGWENDDVIGEMDGLMKALRQALAQPEQELVAWFQVEKDADGSNRYIQVSETDPEFYVPLYTAPPKREWVGLTKEDMPDGDNPMFDTNEFYAGMAWAAAKLKEKNT